MKKGNLSINSENIFPIIKKWLYSDHDIFVRELISNATDAITKLKKLSLAGEFTKPEGDEYKINVEVSPKQKLIRFIDNGIGMTEEEVEKYINQIAFSGAVDFIEKYKDKTNEEQIIGHFGLGFYSAFMVADKVSIDTLSYKEGAKPIHWVSDGGLEFEMGEGNRASRGTAITLYLNDNCHEFANEFRVREILNKYCSFMPVEIFLKDIDAEEATEIIEKDELLESDTVIETIIEPAKEKIKIKKRPVALNDIHPLWTKHPNECSDEEYIEFYRKVFMDYKEPLFWIHLNMDYPFNLKGILYFPKINTEYDSIEGTIKLYNNQVFIADNIKEVIPEFLLLLKGVIDSADIPLNVSRSALQNDGSVRKISEYIAKKVADKLSGMCKTERDKYEKYWDDIAPFIKYGYLKDEKFAKKVEDYILFKNINDKYLTLNELVDESKNSEETLENSSDETSENAEEKKEVEKTQIFYVNDVKEQSQYVNIFKSAGKDAVVLPHSIDVPFISTLEMKRDNVKFLRIDSDMTDDMRSEEVAEDTKASYDALSEKVKTALHNDRLKVSVQLLKSDEISSVITISEESRRMQEMLKQYGMMGMDPSMFGGEGETLVLNANHPLVKELLENNHEELFDMICEQLYDLASISHSPLSPERMSAFIKRSNELMLKLK